MSSVESGAYSPVIRRSVIRCPWPGLGRHWRSHASRTDSSTTNPARPARQAVLERTGRGHGERDVTIVFTDIVGFSTWSLGAGDADTLTLLRKVSKAVEPAVAAGGGHVVKRLGDGIMAVFYHPDKAVEAVVTARAALARVEVNGYTPTMRVGIHTGSPRQIGSDWLGVDVTVAARVMQAGGNGNVMISHTALDALPEGTLEELGLTTRPYRRGFFAPKLSGVPEDLKIVRLIQTPER